MVAWIWSFIWHLPLDLIKWAMAYILNEDGFRDRMHGRQPSTVIDAPPVEPVPEGGAPATGGAPAAEGRPSVARTSLGRTSLGRTSAGGGRPNIGRNSVQVWALKFSFLSGKNECVQALLHKYSCPLSDHAYEGVIVSRTQGLLASKCFIQTSG